MLGKGTAIICPVHNIELEYVGWTTISLGKENRDVVKAQRVHVAICQRCRKYYTHTNVLPQGYAMRYKKSSVINIGEVYQDYLKIKKVNEDTYLFEDRKEMNYLKELEKINKEAEPILRKIINLSAIDAKKISIINKCNQDCKCCEKDNSTMKRTTLIEINISEKRRLFLSGYHCSMCGQYYLLFVNLQSLMMKCAKADLIVDLKVHDIEKQKSVNSQETDLHNTIQKEDKAGFEEKKELVPSFTSEQKFDLELEIKSLLLDKASLNEQINTLKREKESILRDIGNLKRQEASLSLENNSLYQELSEKKKTISTLDQQYNELKNKIDNLEQYKSEIKELEGTIFELKEEKVSLNSQISQLNSTVDTYISNLDKRVLECKIDSILFEQYNRMFENGRQQTEIVSPENSLYIEPGFCVSKENRIQCLEMEDYFDVADDNLLAVCAKMPKGLLCGCFNAAELVGLHPLICGYQSREVAIALVAAKYAEQPSIISIPAGYANIGSLIDNIEKLPTRSVIIEDAFGKMNENILFPLLRKQCKKVIIFTAESISDFNRTSSYMLNYIYLINLYKYRVPEEQEIAFASAENLFKKQIFDTKTEINNLVKKFLNHTELTQTYIYLRGQFMNALLENGLVRDKVEAVKFMIISELRWILNEKQAEKFADSLEEVFENKAENLRHSLVIKDNE